MKEKTYQEYYDLFLPDVMARDNFKESHLTQLEILCKLYVECGLLEEMIREMGWTYISQGRNGHQEKLRPEVTQLNRNRAEIRAYSKMLGLLLVKDSVMGNGQEESSDWD